MKKYLSLVKFSHTIFAMPFAMLGYFLAVNLPEYDFSSRTLLLVILCMVFARNAAMAFNRWADQDIDQQNPRTAIREIPAGLLKSRSVLWFTIINALLFIATTFFINKLCFALSPVALIIVLGYSLTKRFTALCHVVLGLGLSLAPIGAYLAVTGVFHWIPVLFSFAILFWVSGFDILYALQDEGFDHNHGLYSIPSTFGRNRAMMLSNIIHACSALFILLGTYYIDMQYDQSGILSWVGAFIFVAMIIYQHTLVKPNDLSKINLAFFTTNGFASLIFGSMVILDLYF